MPARGSFYSQNPDEFMNRSRRVSSKNLRDFSDLFWGTKKAKDKYFSHKLEFDMIEELDEVYEEIE